LEETGTGHLTAEEIAGLIAPGGSIPEGRATHASSCDRCRRITEMHHEEQNRLERLAGGPRGGPSDTCPPPGEWGSLAAGLTAPGRAEELLAHVAQCDACGAILHAAVEDFSRETSAAENESLAALQSARPDWQRRMAGRMAEASGKRRVVTMSPRVWLARAAAVVLAVGAGWWAWAHWSAGDPARLLAKAYTQQRPYDFRMPGATQAGVRMERGAKSSFQRPAALLEAEAKIARELEKDPDSVKFLDLRARAEMLGWDPETAIATLQRALEHKPDDPDLMADLGIAYALRAEVQNRDVDYGYASEYLSRALKAKPNAGEAVFNRAVVYDRMFLYEDAIREWRHYLELDPNGAWREEAERRLADLEQKKKSGRKP
jgi:tetratricopeptide (TPR) repeat protein